MYQQKFLYKILKLCKDLPIKFIYEKNIENKLKKLSIYNKIMKLEVLDGNFKGMKYPTADSAGSSFYPKIIGSYEKELEEVIKEAIQYYDVLIDVGCAEGYYAVGFAYKNKNSKIYAFDSDSRARSLCENLALKNNVKDNIVIEEFFDEKSYLKILNENPNKKILLLIDAEGYEAIILNPNLKKLLNNTDLLIEVHDFIDSKITDICHKFLENEFKIQTIYSIDDFQKALDYRYSETSSLENEIKFILFKEGRPEQMKWFYAKKN